MAGQRTKNFPEASDLFPTHYDNNSEIINANDINQIQDAIVETQEEVIAHKEEMTIEIEDLKSSVNDGKQEVRNAIIDKGGVVSDEDEDGIPTFEELSMGISNIQTTHYFGTGKDGILDTDGNLTFTVSNPNLPILKEYESVKINAGHNVTTSSANNGLILMSKGDIVIDGTITMSQKGYLVDTTKHPAYAPEIVLFEEVELPSGGDGGNGGRAAGGQSIESGGKEGNVYGGGRGGGGAGGSVGRR